MFKIQKVAEDFGLLQTIWNKIVRPMLNKFVSSDLEIFVDMKGEFEIKIRQITQTFTLLKRF